MLYSPHTLSLPVSDFTVVTFLFYKSARELGCIKTYNLWRMCWDQKYRSKALNNTRDTEKTHHFFKSYSHSRSLAVALTIGRSSSSLCYCRREAFRFLKMIRGVFTISSSSTCLHTLPTKILPVFCRIVLCACFSDWGNLVTVLLWPQKESKETTTEQVYPNMGVKVSLLDTHFSAYR